MCWVLIDASKAAPHNRRSQFLAFRLFHGLEMQMRVRQQSADSLSAVRSADEGRSSRSGGAVGHMQQVIENESDTRISGKLVTVYRVLQQQEHHSQFTCSLSTGFDLTDL